MNHRASEQVDAARQHKSAPSAMLAMVMSLVSVWVLAAPGRTFLAAPHPNGPRLPCGTSISGHVPSPRQVGPEMADGEPFGFDQDPPLLFPNYAGTVTLRNFEILGDYAVVQFRRFDRSLDDPPELWERFTSRSVDGRLISIFEPQWPEDVLSRALSSEVFGFDSPQLYWGTLDVPGTSISRPIYLRAGLGGLPASEVVRVNDQVQYASNVVNLVIPGFGDSRIMGGPQAFELDAAGHMFFQYFADAYDVLAVVPVREPMAAYAAFHRNVRNIVRGLNIPLFDDSQAYGTTGVLEGVEVYTDAHAARVDITDHEMAHQWGTYFNWTRIAAIAPAGAQPAAHSPLWTGGETLLGAVLNPDRRVRTLPDGYDIEQTPAPIRYHPVERYAMGAIDAADVPDFRVFVAQDQFESGYPASPDVGTPVTGDAPVVRLDDVIRIHGRRQGPAPTLWRRATILVSRERLVSQREMDYWNFFSQRLADRNHEVRPTLEGSVPFRAATNDAIALTTMIAPRDREPLAEELNIDSPTFGPTDWPGIELQSDVPTRFVSGEPVNLSGTIRAAGLRGAIQIAVVFYDVAWMPRASSYGTIGRSGDFSVRIRFGSGQEGRYIMGIFLLSPGAEPSVQAFLSSVSVESRPRVVN